MSATPDTRLANPELLIADLQRQLAQCRAETREALGQQTATAEVLQVINSSPGNLAPVFDAMLDRALQLCLADYGVLWIRDRDLIRAGAIRGASEEFVDFLLRERAPVDADTLIARACASAR